MPPAVACANISRIEYHERSKEFVCITVSTGVNELLKEMIEKRPYVNEARFQIHASSFDLYGLIIELKPLVRYRDVVKNITANLKLWHEIESGWLNSLPTVEITTVKRNRPVKERFIPDPESIGCRLGRTIACKEWAILHSKEQVVAMYARQESALRRQLT